METWTIFEMRAGRKKLVYRGPVDEEVLNGLHSIQPVAFGRRYWLDGRIMRDSDDRLLGFCKFERVIE